MKKILTIDVGVKNVGISLIEARDNVIQILGKKLCWDNWKSDCIKYLKCIIDEYYITKPINIVLERQYHNKNLIAMTEFIRGYFSALGHRVIICNPLSKNKNLKTRSDRKGLSLEYIKELIKISSYRGPDITTKYHDICDSISLGLKVLNSDLKGCKIEIIIDKIQ